MPVRASRDVMLPAAVQTDTVDADVGNFIKVTPPRPYCVHLNRRLFARLDASPERPIIWIHGPPGAGKTTLAASYLADNCVEPLWYRLDEGDADPAALFFYLGAAWQGRKIGLTLLSAARVSRLCALALKSNIEPDFVRTFIHASETPAPDPDDDTWPWPLKVTTLGGLTVSKAGEPLNFGRKTPKRLVMLLKAIVAYGGSDVPQEKLIDAIWPDEDGDAGYSSLKVAIHRLRQLLGDTGVLVFKSGRVGLDPSRCWLDIWTFDRRLARRAPDEAETRFRQRQAQGLTLYRGDFLVGDEDLWWTARRRSELRDRYARAVG